MRTPAFSIVVAADENNGIGIENQLPWRISRDMNYFKHLTSAAQPGRKNLVIMGRKTWDSIPEKFRPLPDRQNIVLSRTSATSLPPEVTSYNSLDTLINALPRIQRKENIENIFIIGGGQIYSEAIKHPACDTIYLTHIQGNYACDAFFPDYKKEFKLFSQSEVLEENGVKYSFEIWKRYLDSKS